jgi:oxygen-independent coproporphyrinogen-3 oxidase
VFSSNPPLGLYIHLPWCEKKCPYCDFNSYQADGTIPEREYVDALLNDLEQDLPLVWGRGVDSIFIGGGTPSLFSADAIERLFSGLRALINFSPAIEITLESNPGSADIENYRGYRETGINRLSIGVQSFDDQKLSSIGRVHDGAQALAAFAGARAAGFDNINLDLMFALPGQSLAEAQSDLAQAIALGPEHISHYQLTLEPNTLFHSRPPAKLPDDDTCWELQTGCQALLAAAGYRGKITLAAENRVIRRMRQRQPRAYLESAGRDSIVSESELGTSDLCFEFMLNALRLKDGFASSLFYENTGLPLNEVLPGLETARDKGLLEFDGARIKPTELGFCHLNDLQAAFLSLESANNRPIFESSREIMHN